MLALMPSCGPMVGLTHSTELLAKQLLHMPDMWLLSVVPTGTRPPQNAVLQILILAGWSDVPYHCCGESSTGMPVRGMGLVGVAACCAYASHINILDA